MGGLWTEYTATSDGQLMEYGGNSMMTGIPGLFAFGEANYQYHGATRLGANALLVHLRWALLWPRCRQPRA